ncbi:MAG: hypothetical protein L3J29_04405 [Cyclobacteriaceae bacterium]|nr:hypothetical protein [Cyclobacteriaceae bacterium]
MKWLHNLLIYSSVFSVIVPISVVIIKKIQKKYICLFTLFLTSLFSDLVSIVLSSNGLTNLLVINGYFLISGVLLILYFSNTKRFESNFSTITIPSFVLVYLFSYSIDGLYTFNTIGISLEAILMIFLCLYVFYDLYKKEETIYVDRLPEFWITTAILMYFSGALFSFLLATDILSQSPDRFYNSWILHNSANILKNILFAIGLWKVRLVKV